MLKLRKNTSLNLKTTLIFLALLIPTTVSKRLLEVQLASTSSNHENIGKIIGIILKIIQIICFFIMVFDCVSRFQGNPKRWISVYRFIAVTYGTSVAWFVGSEDPRSYRVYNGYYLEQYFTKIYNAEGWFGSGFMSIFGNAKVNDQDYGFEVVNALFFEGIIFFILILGALITAPGLGERKKISHLFGSLYYVYMFYMSFPFLYIAIMFVKQHVDLNNSADSGNTVNRKFYGYYFSWIATIAIFIMTVILVGYLVMEALEMPEEIKERYGIGRKAGGEKAVKYKESQTGDNHPIPKLEISNNDARNPRNAGGRDDRKISKKH